MRCHVEAVWHLTRAWTGKPGCLAWTPHPLQAFLWALLRLIASVSSSVRNTVTVLTCKTVVRIDALKIDRVLEYRIVPGRQ